MNLKLKVFGPALVAALAMGAVGASAATAAVKHFEAPELGAGESVSLTGEQTTTESDRIHFGYPEFWETFICDEIEYEATAGKVTTEITITPRYAKCHTLNIPMDLEMNGCHYVLTLHTGVTSTGGTTHTHGPTHISCPVGKSITTKITQFGFTVCTIHIPAQTPTVSTVDYKNLGAGATRAIELTTTVEGIVYTITDGGFCPGPEFNHDGFFTGKLTLNGYEDTGTPLHNNQQTALRVVET